MMGGGASCLYRVCTFLCALPSTLEAKEHEVCGRV
jgi:hypothetical protein